MPAMKRYALFAVLCLLCGFASVSVAQTATTSNPAYPLQVHVIASSAKYECSDVTLGNSVCHYDSVVQAMIAGQKYQLDANTGSFHLLALGTYPAAEITDKSRSYEVNRSYVLLFPDKSTRKYRVTGMMQ